MKKKDTDDILTYIQGGLNPKKHKELGKRLSLKGYDLKELDSLRQIDGKLGKISIPKTGKEMDHRFYRMLENHKQEEAMRLGLWDRIQSRMDGLHIRQFGIGLAYSLLLLFIGWSAGTWLTSDSSMDTRLTAMSTELLEMKTMMAVSLLDHPSPTERIKAVHSFSDQAKTNVAVAQRLMETLNNDPNINVRLVTLEVLVQLVDDPHVREGLIHTINRQESPLMQLAITDVMVGLQEREAIDPLKEILEKKELNYTVRRRIEQGLDLLI
jgi:hypothetical protein